MKPSKYAKPAWTPFERGHLPKISEAEIVAKAKAWNIPLEQVKQTFEDIEKHEAVYINSIYQVNIRKTPPIIELWPDMLHLSIKRRDKKPIHDWRHMQRIKNELVGDSYEGIELYPAEERVVDTSNQYHIWVFYDPNFRLNLGWKERLIRGYSAGGTVQRPFDE